MGYVVAVIGATGVVGQAMLSLLQERRFPADKVLAIASEKSVGKKLAFGHSELICQSIHDVDFSKVDIALMSAGSSLSKQWAPHIGQSGCVVIDNSSFWRYDDQVPLVIPEVNPDAIHDFKKRYIIANPNCSTAQMLVALKPLHQQAVIKRIVVSTYQSVSGAGQAAIQELQAQLRDPTLPAQKFTKPIANNLIPHIDSFLDNGDTREEWKMIAETAKILDPAIKVSATCVRVPVFVGHSESINLELEHALTTTQARQILAQAPGCQVIDEQCDGGYITPLECAGRNETFISRIRDDKTVPHGLNLWVVCDNLRKGAALNAIQIAELLHQKQLLTSS